MDKKSTPSDPVYEKLGFKHNLKYGPRSSLRRLCSRFLRFSYLLDFLTMDALSNVWIDSVQHMLIKLHNLNDTEVDVELYALKNEFGSVAKRAYARVPPLFLIQAKFEEDEIPANEYKTEKIDKYEPPPFGHSKPEDFDPVVHLELEEERNDEDDEDQEMNMSEMEEVDERIERTIIPNLHKYWLKMRPSKTDYFNSILTCFQEGMDCLKNFERWSRHAELEPYVNILESWDDKVCDEWDPPDEDYLNCESWLEDNEIYKNHKTILNQELEKAFGVCDRFYA